MHELSVTESILKIAQRHANQAGAKRITNIYMVIGQLSSLIDDSIQFYWHIISKETLAEGAVLHFKRIPAELKCLKCGYIYKPGDRELSCPSCDSISVKIIKGEEFFLEAIDVE
jgi:hydrogenase nickel incorporation protein HypA/HybF